MRAVENSITQEQVRALLSCDPETGVLIWRVNRRGPHAKNGAVAGSVRPDGYIRVKLFWRNFYAHRIVWMYFTGEWPMNEIDHRDGNRSNNRFDNLRHGTKSNNLQNQKKAQRSNKSSGLLGVSWDKCNGKWSAQIYYDGKLRRIGYYAYKEEAHAAYLEKKRQVHEFCMI